jgi:hypothetical protein
MSNRYRENKGGIYNKEIYNSKPIKIQEKNSTKQHQTGRIEI